MKKFFASVLFIAIGSGLWWSLANTARLSIRKWDAKFNSTLNYQLTRLGITDADVLSNVQEIKSDNDGSWVVRSLTLRIKSRDVIDQLKKTLEDEGASVTVTEQNKMTDLLVRRGQRLYQNVHLNHSF